MIAPLDGDITVIRLPRELQGPRCFTLEPGGNPLFEYLAKVVDQARSMRAISCNERERFGRAVARALSEDTKRLMISEGVWLRPHWQGRFATSEAAAGITREIQHCIAEAQHAGLM